MTAQLNALAIVSFPHHLVACFGDWQIYGAEKQLVTYIAMDSLELARMILSIASWKVVHISLDN